MASLLGAKLDETGLRTYFLVFLAVADEAFHILFVFFYKIIDK